MSTTATLRRTLCPLRRHVSSTATKNHLSSSSLPPAKMRALISLYHQSDKFISPQNLSKAIDRAFVESTATDIGIATETALDEETLSELRMRLKERRQAPNTSQVRSDDGPTMSARSYRTTSAWSDHMGDREEKVIEALYGVHDRKKPGWEVLEESAESIQLEMQKDREREEQL